MSVKVTANSLDQVIVVSQNNPKFGYVRLEDTSLNIKDSWMKEQKRSVLIHSEVETLQKAGYTKGMELPGKIIVIESLTPSSERNAQREIKVAGETNVICRVGDQPIYRREVYTTNEALQDILIAHTNADEIKAAQVPAITAGADMS